MRSLKAIAAAAALLTLPAIALAAGGGSANPWLDMALKTVNFAILVGVIYYFGRKAIPQALRDRRDNIAKELKEALEAKETAEQKLEEFKNKVVNLEEEVEQLRVDFKAEGEAQKKHILEDAAAAAESIKKNAAAAGEREVRRVSEELRGEAVRQALALAEEILAKSYSAEDQKRALEQTIEKIEGIH